MKTKNIYMKRDIKFIGIIGTRKRDSKFAEIKVETKFLEIYEEGDMIVSGGCPEGGDRFAEVIAKRHGVPILIFYPDKERYGIPACYFVRNDYVAQFANKALIACVAKNRKGGTEDTLTKHEKNWPRGKRIIV